MKLLKNSQLQRFKLLTWVFCMVILSKFFSVVSILGIKQMKIIGRSNCFFLVLRVCRVIFRLGGE